MTSQTGSRLAADHHEFLVLKAFSNSEAAPMGEVHDAAQQDDDAWWQALDWVWDGLVVGAMPREVELTG